MPAPTSPQWILFSGALAKSASLAGRRRLAVALRGGFLAIAMATAMEGREIPPDVKPGTAVNGGASYVGEAVCIACHATQDNQFTHTLHANVFRLNPKGEK
jgi:hypothetical protein